MLHIIQILLVLHWTSAEEPPWIAADYRSEIRTTGGREVIVKCPVCHTNDSSLTVQWYKENKLIDSEQWPRFQMAANGSKLKIVGARVDDSGKYFCTADNGLAKLNISINLHITEDELRPRDCSSEIIKNQNTSEIVNHLLKLVPTKEEVNVSSRTIINCWVLSEDRPTACWLKETSSHEMLPDYIPAVTIGDRQFKVMPSNNTEPMRLNYTYKIPTEEMFVTRMTIDPVDEGHAGVYYCLAVGQFGFKLAATNLIVIEPPDMEQCEQLTVPILVLLLPTSVFLALAGSLVCWMKTRDTASEKSGDQENVFTILGIKRKLI